MKVLELATQAQTAFNDKAKIASASEYVNSLKVVGEYFNPEFKGPRAPFKEMITANDFGILYQRVITDRLQQPVEPQYLGVSLFSRTIELEPNTIYKWPVIGGVVAFEYVANDRIPRQDPAITMNITNMDAKRYGVAFDFEQEMIDDSMYNIVSFLVEAGRRALVRKKEQMVWETCLENAHVTFDNSLSDSNAWTGGKGRDGVTNNASITFDNFIDMMAGLTVNDYNPTDCILNPMAFSILLKDPILRAQFVTAGQIGANIWKATPNLSSAGFQALSPWGIQYHASRFMPVRFGQTLATGALIPTASSGTAYNYTDILFVDRNNPVLIVQREGITTDQWKTDEVEILTLAMREKYAVYGFDMGRSATLAKNVALVQNHEPAMNVGMVNI